MLFLIPVGGGIPAGVLLAKVNGLAWPVTAFLYFVSDVILALLFEPALKLMVIVGRRLPHFDRVAEALRLALKRTSAPYGAGPFALVMIAFGVDPMTGRAAAAAAGHGFVSGWAIAITGDMLYFAVIMVATLRLSSFLGDPNRAMWIVLAAMLIAPLVVRRLHAAFVLRWNQSRA